MTELREKEEYYNEAVGVKQKLETSLMTLQMEMKTMKYNLKKVIVGKISHF
jgi:hypothetical protein